MKAGAKIAAVAAIWMSANLFAGDSRYGLPFATSLPSVDGVMSEREWDEGVTVAGFFAPSAKGRLSAGGDGYATFLTDGSRLFAAWRVRARNVDVDGGLKAAAKNRDGAVYDDDGVELVVQAGTAGKIAHFIFNSIGTAYDSLSSKEDGTDVKWNCAGLKVATSVNGGWWTTEASLPISEIGEAADGLFVNAACTFSGRGSASLNASPSHVFGPKLRLCPMRGAAAVRLYDIGNPRYGYWAPKLSVSCGDPSREFSCEISLREEGAPADAAPAMLKRGTFRSGGRISGKFETRLRKPFVLKALVTDAATGETVYERSVAALRESTDRIPPTASFDLGESEATVFHYPGLGKMRVTVSQTPGMPIKGAACSIAGVEYALDAGKDCFTGLVDVPKGDGEYPLDFALDGAGGRLRFNKAWTLVRRREPWEGKGIGLGRVIVPPFRPITASGGNAIEVILRKYAFGDAGLPSSVRALGREILAGPSFFEGVVDGRRVRFAGGAPSISIADDGYDAAVNAEASAAGVSLKVRSTVEQDGFVWNEVALSGKPAHTIERLTFVMPLKDSEAPLMHACAVDRIRANPAGRVPAGEGEVWNGKGLSRKKDDMVLDQFVPYVWLGAERRGISWFMNSSFGMKLSDEKPAVRIVRRGGTLSLEADFVNVPVDAAEERRFAFGIEATPVKEKDGELEAHFQSAAGFCPDGMTLRYFVQLGTIGMWNQWSRVPHGGDWTLVDLAAGHIRTGTGMAAMKEAYSAYVKKCDGEFRKYAKTVAPTYYGWMRGLADWGMITLGRVDRPSFACVYSDPTLGWEAEPAQRKFRSEWVSVKCGYPAAERNFLTPSCRDRLLHDCKLKAEHGIPGIYFDDMFPVACRNPDVAARRDAEGRWHADVGILEMRDLVKRAAVMQCGLGLRPRLLQIHMTNCLLVPCFSFATSTVSWEDHYGEDFFQKRFSGDYMRAESLGTQIGAEAVALDGIHRRRHPEETWQERFAQLTRSQQAMLLPMGVKTSVRSASKKSGVDTEVLRSAYGALARFGFLEGDCRFVPAYDDDGAIAGAPGTVWVGSYRRPGKALAILGNQSGEEANFKLKVDAKALGLPAGPCFYDGETGKEMTARVKIPAYGFRMVEIVDATLGILKPSVGSTVSQLRPAQARAVGESWKDCRRYFDGGKMSRALKADGCLPNPVVLSWKGGTSPFTVTLRRIPDGKVFFSGRADRRKMTVDSLEIARDWEWTVTDAAGATAKGSFKTADAAPRLVRIDGVPNVRDLGGRLTVDGRRVRQGLLFRSAGLNNNAVKDKAGGMVPGTKRLKEGERKRILDAYGFKCDVDLRRPDEVFGMTESPLGAGVKWANRRFTVYGEFTNATARTRGPELFREILNTNNYPLVFHCIAGADRTGTVAFLLNGLLGVSEEEALKDYLATGFIDHGVTDRRHLANLDSMVAAMNGLPGGSFREKVTGYFMELGFSEKEIDDYRSFMLEHANGSNGGTNR